MQSLEWKKQPMRHSRGGGDGCGDRSGRRWAEKAVGVAGDWRAGSRDDVEDRLQSPIAADCLRSRWPGWVSRMVHWED